MADTLLSMLTWPDENYCVEDCVLCVLLIKQLFVFIDPAVAALSSVAHGDGRRGKELWSIRPVGGAHSLQRLQKPGLFSGTHIPHMLPFNLF